MLPKEYYEDPLTKGVAYGAYQHVLQNRYTLLKLPVGYGKTIISMSVAKALALKSPNKELQIAIIAPKTKRLDKSFDEAIQSTMAHYDVKLSILQINANDIGTFAGLNAMTKKKDLWREFLLKCKHKNTFVILDETHMQLRDANGTASKNFKKIFKEVDKSGKWFKILGLTATPFDKSILDTIGYLILNGEYSSRTDFFKKEIQGYAGAFKRGLTQKAIEDMIVDEQFAIHKEMFTNINGVINKLRKFIYAPDAPRNFHIPQNKFQKLKVTLDEKGLERLKRVEMMDRDKAYADNTSKVVDYTEVLTTNPNVLNILGRMAKSDKLSQPIIFYQYDVTVEAVKKYFDEHDIKYFQVNGNSKDYFEDNDETSPVLVQYFSGATAFESKTSNTSVYLDLPASAIDFEQSLGRNTRRGQDTEVVTNYIICPQKYVKGQKKDTPYFTKRYDRIVNKTIWNRKFEKSFETKWGKYKEDIFA